MPPVLGGSRRLLRAVVFGVVLALAFTACEINVELVTKIEGDGSGRFSLRFVIDKELVDLARNAGEDPFAALACPDELTRTGWVCNRSAEGGGLLISLERAFRSTDELNRAMEELEREAAAQEGPTANFFTLRVSREAGFLRTKTGIEGSVDLTATGVLGNAPPETRQTLEAIVAQAGGEFFAFRLAAELPGKVSRTTGDPERIDGGKVTWTPRLGRKLSFAAESSGYNTTPLALIGGPVLALVLLLAWILIRRRSIRRRDGRSAVETAASAPSQTPAPPA
jgi:hypothetical protein